jgi:phosphatidylinositol glycan class Q protein
MFHQYFQLSYRLRRHYASPRVILCLVTGQFVPPIHRKNLYSLQYSMLPAKRARIGELWIWMTEGPTKGFTGKKTVPAMKWRR